MTLVVKLVQQIKCNKCGYGKTIDPAVEVKDRTCPACEMGEKPFYKLDGPAPRITLDDRVTGHDTHEWVPPGS